MGSHRRKGVGSRRLQCATVALLLAVSCHNAARVAERPFDEAGVREVARRMVATAADEADRSSIRVARERAGGRRDRLADYLDATTQSIEAFRAAVPRLEPGGQLDISGAQEALEDAAAARAALSDSPVDLLRLHTTLDLGAAYLDALAAALGSVESGEPERDQTAFLDRYQRLVERYNAWAEAARRDVEAIDADEVGAFIEDSRAARRRSGLALVRGSWPDVLLETCESALGSAAGGVPLPAIRLALHRELAEVVASSATGLPDACRAAIGPVIEGYAACADSAAQRVEGDEADALDERLERLRSAVTRFETVREQACPADPELRGPLGGADTANADTGPP